MSYFTLHKRTNTFLSVHRSISFVIKHYKAQYPVFVMIYVKNMTMTPPVKVIVTAMMTLTI